MMKYMMKRLMLLTCCFVLQAGIFSSMVWANNTEFWRKKKKKTENVNTVASLSTPYEKLMNKPGRTSSNGMFNLHLIEGKLYVEIPIKLLNRDMLIGTTITETSDNNFGTVGEKTSNPQLIRFTKTDSTVYLRMGGNIPWDVDENDGVTRKALEKSFINPIIAQYPVKVYNSDSTCVVIDMTDYFLSDNEDLPVVSQTALYNMNGGRISKVFQKDKSRLIEVRAFEDNVSIRSQVAYTMNVTLKNKPYLNNEPFLSVLTRSILLLPEKPLRYRYADSRINVFTGEISKLSSTKGFEKEYITLRWRLEPSDEEAYRRGELVEPKKPIVFYIDNNFPETWKPIIKKAVEVWQKPFEKIGFKNAIVAKDFPLDDPTFDPDNLKYSCIRYAPSQFPNAMGPSWCDPRSGEIINASVYVYHNVLQILQGWRFVQTAQADEDIRTVKFDPEILDDCLRYVLSHEIGHCLSFMHNMSASAAIPTDSLRSPSFTQQYGTTYSIMDYARNNYVAQPGDKERGVRLTPPELGMFDYFAVKWLYSPLLDATSPEEEIPTLRKWLDEKSGDPRFRYGIQQKVLGRKDPTSLEEDLGDDPVKSSTYGIKNLKYIMKHLNEWIPGDQDVDGRFRTMLYYEILGQYQRYLQNTSIMIGGVKLYSRYEGDKWPAYELISKEKQIETTRFLLAQVKDMDWLFDPEILTFIPLAGDVKTQLQENIFNLALWSRMGSIIEISSKATEKKMPVYSIDGHVKLVSDFVWSPTREGRNLTMIEKKLQMSFLKNLALGAGMVEPYQGNSVALASCSDEGLLPNSIREAYKNIFGVEIERSNHFGTCTCRENVALVYFSNVAQEQDGQWIAPIFYEELQKVHRLLKNQVNTGNKETRDHYRLLLFRLNQILEK